MLPRLSAPVSGVDCPCPWIHANLCCLPLYCPAATALCWVASSTARPGPPSTASLASPSHFWIRRDFMSKNPLSGFAPKQTIESSALAAQPHSATILHVTDQAKMGYLDLKLKKYKRLAFFLLYNSITTDILSQSLTEESILQVTQTYNNENHEIQYGGCEARQMKAKLSQR